MLEPRSVLHVYNVVINNSNTFFLHILATVFSVICGTSALLFYGWLYLHILKNLPLSFTFGEASVVAQGFVLFLLNAGLRLFQFATYSDELDIEEVSLTLQVSFLIHILIRWTKVQNFSLSFQVGLVGVTFIVVATHFIDFFKNDLWFYLLVAAVSLSVCIFPVKGQLAVTVLFFSLFADQQRVRRNK